MSDKSMLLAERTTFTPNLSSSYFVSTNLIWKPLDPGLEVVEDVDVVIHHKSIVGQEAAPLWLSTLETELLSSSSRPWTKKKVEYCHCHLDHFHELLQLPPPEPGGPAQVLLHGDPLGL